VRISNPAGVENSLIADFRSNLHDGAYEQAVDDIFARRVSPFQAVEKLVNLTG
jgi:hypothetical protein